MDLLLDANISWRICKNLSKTFPNTDHILNHFKHDESDLAIWNYAKINNKCIVTNDTDFEDLLSFKGFPPKVIILKCGNQSNDNLEKLLIKNESNINEFIENPEMGILELY
jgi:predicted nuclease of predicted toxin-antitoxin system